MGCGICTKKANATGKGLGMGLSFQIPLGTYMVEIGQMQGGVLQISDDLTAIPVSTLETELPSEKPEAIGPAKKAKKTSSKKAAAIPPDPEPAPPVAAEPDDLSGFGLTSSPKHKKYQQQWKVVSHSSGETYTISQTHEGKFECSCKAWINYPKFKENGCKHIKALIASNFSDYEEKVF